MMAVVFLDVWSSNKHGIGQTPLMDGVPGDILGEKQAVSFLNLSPV